MFFLTRHTVIHHKNEQMVKRRLTRRNQAVYPNLTGSACWHQPAEFETHMPFEKPRPLAHPSSPSFHISPAAGSESWHKGRISHKVAMGPSTRNDRSIFPRSEDTNRRGHTTSGVRTSTVASQARRTHHDKYVL